MSEREMIAAQLHSVRKELMEAVDRLDDSMLAWAPGPGMRTVHGQLVEVLMTEMTVIDRLEGRERRAIKEVEAPFRAHESMDELRVDLDSVRARTLELLTDANLSADAGVSSGLKEWLELDTVTIGEMFRYIARHESYHSGQLTAYLWARGDDPYDW